MILLFGGDTFGNVFAPDERQALPKNLFLPIGKLKITPKLFCTAALVGPYHLLSAKHCLLDKRTGKVKHPLPIFEIRDANGRIHRARILRFHAPYPHHNPNVFRGADTVLMELDLKLGNSIGFMPIQPFRFDYGDELSLLAFHHDQSLDQLFHSGRCRLPKRIVWSYSS